MLHYLTLGHLDPEAVRKGQAVAIRALERETVLQLLKVHGRVNGAGEASLGSFPVEITDGYVVCPWLMPHTIAATERFASDLMRETGCLVAEIRKRLLLGTDAFQAHLAAVNPSAQRSR